MDEGRVIYYEFPTFLDDRQQRRQRQTQRPRHLSSPAPLAASVSNRHDQESSAGSEATGESEQASPYWGDVRPDEELVNADSNISGYDDDTTVQYNSVEAPSETSGSPARMSDDSNTITVDHSSLSGDMSLAENSILDSVLRISSLVSALILCWSLRDMLTTLFKLFLMLVALALVLIAMSWLARRLPGWTYTPLLGYALFTGYSSLKTGSVNLGLFYIDDAVVHFSSIGTTLSISDKVALSLFNTVQFMEIQTQLDLSDTVLQDARIAISNASIPFSYELSSAMESWSQTFNSEPWLLHDLYTDAQNLNTLMYVVLNFSEPSIQSLTRYCDRDEFDPPAGQVDAGLKLDIITSYQYLSTGLDTGLAKMLMHLDKAFKYLGDFKDHTTSIERCRVLASKTLQQQLETTWPGSWRRRNINDMMQTLSQINPFPLNDTSAIFAMFKKQLQMHRQELEPFKRATQSMQPLLADISCDKRSGNTNEIIAALSQLQKTKVQVEASERWLRAAWNQQPKTKAEWRARRQKSRMQAR